MGVLNAILNGLFEVLLIVPSALFREAGLLLVSALFGVGMVLLFRRVSNQEAIRRRKDSIKGRLLSLSLYPHEIGLALRTYPKIMAALGGYLALMLTPALWLAGPFLIVAIQMETRYGRVPLRPGQAVVVSALFGTGERRGLPEGVALEVPPGLELETPNPVRIPAVGEVAWRVRAREAGEFAVTVVTGGESYDKTVTVGEGLRTLSVMRPGEGFIAQAMNPGEPPIPGMGGLKAIRIEYPRGEVSLFFWETHWLVFFVVVSMAVALVARYPLHTEL